MSDSESSASHSPIMSSVGLAGCKRNDRPSMLTGERHYILRLGDGDGWELVADEGTAPWLAKFASILHLEPCAPGGQRRIYFVRSIPGADINHHPVFRLIRALWGNLSLSEWMFRSFRSLHFWTHPDIPDVICELHEEDDELDIIRMDLSLFPVYWRVLQTGGLPLHSALVEKDGKAFLLPAAGGTGKSTCCRRIPPPWKALSDDFCLAVTDGKGSYRVHPLPTWSIFSSKGEKPKWDIRRHLPLSAIFFLEQGRADRATPVGHGQAAALIAESAGQICQFYLRDHPQEQRRGFAEMIFRNACELARSVPAFRLQASKEGRFWEKMEEAACRAGVKGGRMTRLEDPAYDNDYLQRKPRVAMKIKN